MAKIDSYVFKSTQVFWNRVVATAESGTAANSGKNDVRIKSLKIKSLTQCLRFTDESVYYSSLRHCVVATDLIRKRLLVYFA